MSFELTLQHQLTDLSLDIMLSGGSGVTAIFGPSGAGKTTIIKLMAGLLHPNSGRFVLSGNPIFDTSTNTTTPTHKRRMGYVFQDGRLFPHMSVAQNLSIGKKQGSGVLGAQTDLIDLLDIGALMERRPATLSGGEIQRVALARALLSDPQMLLMDEPLAALDGPRKDEILPYLDRLKVNTKIPILYVTHSVEEIARLADDIAILENGKITRHGSVFDVLSDPAAMPLLGVREAGAILTATVADTDADGLTRLTTPTGDLELPGVHAPKGDLVRLRILARDVILATSKPSGLSARNILPVKIHSIDHGRGPGSAIVLTVGSQKLLARITDKSRTEMNLSVGQDIFAILKATAVARGSITT